MKDNPGDLAIQTWKTKISTITYENTNIGADKLIKLNNPEYIIHTTQCAPLAQNLLRYDSCMWLNHCHAGPNMFQAYNVIGW